MSAEATDAAMAPQQARSEVDATSKPQNANDSGSPKPTTGLHSPPDSNSAMKLDSSDESELSDLEDPEPSIDVHLPSLSSAAPTSTSDMSDEVKKETDQEVVEEEEDEDIGEVLPDHWSGTVPVFKPDMRQFKDFKKFMAKIDSYGMKSGIVKIIPPSQWRESLPAYDEMVKQVRVREPIKQDIMGSNGTYRQVNILHQRSYNLPQWRQLCDQSEHQPPARRGERRANADKPKPPPKAKPPAPSGSVVTASRGRGGRSRRGRPRRAAAVADGAAEQDRPMTPVSPRLADDIIESVERDDGDEIEEDDYVPSPVGRMGGVRQPRLKTQSTSARRKGAKRESSAKIDEAAFKDWDYTMDISEYTPERCEELERIYWKTLTYATPLYGADLLGTLFSEETELWNLNKLPNLLDVLGTKVPGVNTAYLYLGMWKATFAWHLEDVDLYSINYLHFGAPKQWYSISQGDARRFEAAMKSIWPTDAKACDQFLRHKAFLISPNHLWQHFKIKVNKCVSYPGEFVVTYPYGYHSGYNLGYNCAEAVNFALDSWLPMGKIAKKCECAQAQDSVWVDVYEIERKLRGESTDYEETDDDHDEEEEEDDDTLLPTPQSKTIRFKQPARKRKRGAADKGEKKVKKIKLRVRGKSHVEPPCCLCPNHILDAELLPTDDGRKAHRICALYGPETWIETVDDKEIVTNVSNISKARLELKCLYCRSKRGACFQCSQKKCARSYHATCAAAAGVFVEEGEVPIFSEDGTEYKEKAFEFSCRFHRTKRDKKLDSNALEECKRTCEAAAALQKGEIAQMQFYRGDIFAGVVVENRHDEQTLLLEIIPNGDRVEVEWKWLLLPDPADYHLPKASSNAIPMPTSRSAKDKINATKRAAEELPRADDEFVEGFTWAEFHTAESLANTAQVKIDLSQDNQLWHYLGKTSTEARAQYTEDIQKQTHNSKSNFLDTIPRPPPRTVVRHVATPVSTPIKIEKPYQYKPKISVASTFKSSPYTQQMCHVPPYTAQQFAPIGVAGQPFPTTTSAFAPPLTGSSGNGSPTIAGPMPQPPKTDPKPAQYSKIMATPVATPPSYLTHSRNKSLPSGLDSRHKTSSTYGSARYETGCSSSPFSYGIMQPPGLGTAPSPQNGHVFQAQARERSNSAASNKSFTMPMTSSAIRPSSSASSQSLTGPPQVKLPLPKPSSPSVLQKYSFFQIHHNRDSSTYRTPYAPWGGFTNGYEGNLREHLMKTPEALFGNKRLSADYSDHLSNPSLPRYLPNGSTNAVNPSSTSPPGSSTHQTTRQPSVSSTPPYTSDSRAYPEGNPLSAPNPASSAILQTASGPYDPNSILTKLHPAIRAQYAAMLQRKNAQVQAHELPVEQDHSQIHRSPTSTVSPSIHPKMAMAPEQSSTIYQSHRVSQPQSHHISPIDQQKHVGSAQVNRPNTQAIPNAVQNSASPAARGLQVAPGQIKPARQIPANQTFVPPPKPWEQLQTTSTHGSSVPTKSATTPAKSTVSPASKESSSSQHVPAQELQLSNSQSAAEPRSVSADQSSLAQQEIAAPKPVDLDQTKMFPEVPAGSLDLVEEIIRNAKRASGIGPPIP